MSQMQKQIVDLIRRNRISTTEIADCLGKNGVVEGVSALNRGFHRVGPVFWTYARNDSNWDFHDQISEAPEGSIILTEVFNFTNRAVFGELVAKYLLLYRQVVGIVARCLLRDGANLIRENWPIWLEGLTPIGAWNTAVAEPLDASTIESRRQQYHGAIAVCDDTGVVVIPPHEVDPGFCDKLARIEEQEDIWFDCIDRKKWNTFETVCLKRYLNQEPKG